MIENKENKTRESEAAFALTVILTNVLLLAVLGACFRFVIFVIRENRSLDAIVNGRFLS